MARLPLLAHVLMLGIALCALLPHMDVRTAWVGDEGSYAVQVRNLADRGTWQYDYVAHAVDRSGTWVPILGEDGQNGRYFTYVKHPVHIMVLRLSVGLFGEGVGFYLPSILGAILAAVAAWLLAAEFDRRAAPFAFWVVALSPVAINAYLLWAHALSAGAAGLATVGAVRTMKQGPRPAPLCLLLGGIAFGVLLRSEGIIFALALAVGLAVAVRARFGLRRAASVVFGCILVVVVVHTLELALIEVIHGGSVATFSLRGGVIFALALAVGLTPVMTARLGRHRAASVVLGCALVIFLAAGLRALLVRAITGGTLAEDSPRAANRSIPYLTRQFTGAWHELIRGSEYTRPANRVVLAALVLVLVAGFLLRGRRRIYLVLFAGLVGSALFLYWRRFADRPEEATTGLLAAWPLAVAAIGSVRWRRMTSLERVILLSASAYALGILATEYEYGGGLEWGGRYLSPVLVPAGVLVTLVLYRQLQQQPRPMALVALPLLAALAVLPTVFGLRMLRTYRLEKDPFYAELTRGSPIVMILGPQFLELPRSAWKLDGRVHWIDPPTDAEARVALQELHASGLKEITLLKERSDTSVTGAPYLGVRDVTGPRTAAAGWQLLDLHA